MLDTVRRYVEAGRDALTPKKAEELARALVKQGQARTDQVQQLARELAEWSKKNSERFRDTIRREVQKQMTKAGAASKDEMESLKRRIRRLETEAKAGAKTAASKAKKSTTAKSTSAKSPGRKAAGSRGGTTGATLGGGTPGSGGAAPTA